MSTYFAKVLAQESTHLAEVVDRATLADWRCRVVGELMTPGSPYALALRQPGGSPERTEFLGRWQELIEGSVVRLLQADGTADASCAASAAGCHEIDPHQIAVLILAALHGGSALSRVAQDAQPLDAALDLALASLMPKPLAVAHRTPGAGQ